MKEKKKRVESCERKRKKWDLVNPMMMMVIRMMMMVLMVSITVRRICLHYAFSDEGVKMRFWPFYYKTCLNSCIFIKTDEEFVDGCQNDFKKKITILFLLCSPSFVFYVRIDKCTYFSLFYLNEKLINYSLIILSTFLQWTVWWNWGNKKSDRANSKPKDPTSLMIRLAFLKNYNSILKNPKSSIPSNFYNNAHFS